MELLYLWIDNYRNIQKQGFNFSSEWKVTYEPEKKIIQIKRNSNHIHGYFPKSIINTTAIVGKNGSGKSNLLSFIRNEIFDTKCEQTCFYLVKYQKEFHLYFHPEYNFSDQNIEGPNSEQGKILRFGFEKKSTPTIEIDEDGNPKVTNVGSWSRATPEMLNPVLKVFYSNFLDTNTGRGSGFNKIIDISTDFRLTNSISKEDPKSLSTSQYELYQNRDIDSIFDLLSRDFAKEKAFRDIFSFNSEVPTITLTIVNEAYSFHKLYEDIVTYLEQNTSRNKWGIEQFQLQFGPLMRGEENAESPLDKLFKLDFSVTQKPDIEIYLLKSLLMNFLFNLGMRYASLKEEALEKNDAGTRILPNNLVYQPQPKDYDSCQEFLREFWGQYEEDQKALKVLEFFVKYVSEHSVEEIFQNKPSKSISPGNLRGSIELSQQEYQDFRKLYHSDFLGLFFEKGMDNQYLILKRPVTFTSYSWSYFSSGQLELMKFFARLLELEDSENYRVRNNYQGAPPPSWEEVNTVLLLLDETGLGFHPEWQRKFMYMLLNGITLLFKETDEQGNDISKKFQIILTSHSPFQLSDLTDDHAIFLRKDEETEKCEVQSVLHRRTFAANLYDLLNDSFFLEEGTTGEWAKEKLIEVIKYLEHDSIEIIHDKAHFLHPKNIRDLISKIGERIIREKLMELYQSKFPRDRQQVDEEIRQLEARIEELKKRKDD